MFATVQEQHSESIFDCFSSCFVTTHILVSSECANVYIRAINYNDNTFNFCQLVDERWRPFPCAFLVLLCLILL